jgi:hypothetical protein
MPQGIGQRAGGSPGFKHGQIPDWPRPGQSGDPSVYPSTGHSQKMGTPLKGALDPDCDDELFDCQNVEGDEEEMNEQLLREFVRTVFEAKLHRGTAGGKVSLSLGTSTHNPTVSGGNRSNYQNDTIFDGEEVEEDELIDEDELEAAEEDAFEVNAGGVPGVSLPMGMSTPSYGQKRMPAWKANAKAFGGADLAKPVTPRRKKSSK